VVLVLCHSVAEDGPTTSFHIERLHLQQEPRPTNAQRGWSKDQNPSFWAVSFGLGKDQRTHSVRRWIASDWISAVNKDSGRRLTVTAILPTWCLGIHGTCGVFLIFGRRDWAGSQLRYGDPGMLLIMAVPQPAYVMPVSGQTSMSRPSTPKLGLSTAALSCIRWTARTAREKSSAPEMWYATLSLALPPLVLRMAIVVVQRRTTWPTLNTYKVD
jgi:hypothetical protein